MEKFIKFNTTILMAILMLAIVSNSDAAINNNISMKVFFTEFNVKTYSPVTMENVEDNSNYIIFFHGKHDFTNDLVTKLESSKSTLSINTKLIRLKIILSDSENNEVVYFVDSEGVVLRKNDLTVFVLSNSLLDTIQRKILYFKGVVDMKPTLDQWGNNP